MSLNNVSPNKKKKENDILKEIYNAIDVKKNIIFNSGAGAGKTFSLIECLKYIIKKYNDHLKYNNQKIICITYTNVAANEVKKRLGRSSTVLISTIHERIWSLIQYYKKELIQIHKENLINQIKQLESKIEKGKEYEKYYELNDKQKSDFEKIICENKEIYYKYYSYPAKQFKSKLNMIEENFSGILSNVGNFKKIVDTIFKIQRYKACITNIDLNKTGFDSIKYDSMYNSDRLEKMRISHDTVLEYGLRIIEKYDLLKQIIIDKYPYILIDEYQDTDEKVIQIMNCLNEYAIEIGHKIFIAYFGDIAQNIYNKGVGKKIFDIHKGLITINKLYNRRSTKEIIDVSNKIRKDEIIQESIFEDCLGGSIKFYYGTSECTRSFINKYIYEWNTTKNNPLHCFVLTNKSVAKYSGFENLYDLLSNTGLYSGSKREQFNTEFLSTDLSKLGEIPSMLYRVMKLIIGVKDGKTQLKEILPAEVFDMNIKNLKELIKALKEINGDTFGECIECMIKIYYEDNVDKYKILIEKVLDLKNISMDIFNNYLIEKLYPNLLDEEEEKAQNTIREILNIKMLEYKAWYKYILNKSSDAVIYHTFHGTKGLEFNNVIILMENAFGKTKHYFDFFFKEYKNFDILDDKKKESFEQIKNLLYVSVSRAIVNLRILYLDDISEFKDGIKEIFDEVYHYNSEDNYKE